MWTLTRSSYKCNVNAYEIETSGTVNPYITAMCIGGHAAVIDFGGVVLYAGGRFEWTKWTTPGSADGQPPERKWEWSKVETWQPCWVADWKDADPLYLSWDHFKSSLQCKLTSKTAIWVSRQICPSPMETNKIWAQFQKAQHTLYKPGMLFPLTHRSYA